MLLQLHSAINDPSALSLYLPSFFIGVAFVAGLIPRRSTRPGSNPMRRDPIPTPRALGFMAGLALLLSSASASANEYDDTVKLFKGAGASASFFNDSYGYAVFPTIGKGGFIVGGAHGSGRVYERGKYVGDAKVTQVSVGFQAGGQAFSEIIFFQDRRAFEEFTRGNFEFGADASAVAITAAATGSAGTEGATAGASGGKKDATTKGSYYRGMAVFTVVKGGAMYEASLGGEKFSYTRRESDDH